MHGITLHIKNQTFYLIQDFPSYRRYTGERSDGPFAPCVPSPPPISSENRRLIDSGQSSPETGLLRSMAGSFAIACSGNRNATMADRANAPMANWMEAVKLPEVSAR